MSNYIKAYPYEIFVRVAFTCPRGDEHGASAHFMQQLLDAEAAQSPEMEKYLQEMKTYMDAALEQFHQQLLSTDEKIDLMAMKHKVHVAKTGNELCAIVQEALQVTAKLMRG
jgi:hypothetical protein